jgi:hypothetical protein
MESSFLPDSHLIYSAKESEVSVIKLMIEIYSKKEGREQEFKVTEEYLLTYLFGSNKIASADFYSIDGNIVGLMIYHFGFNSFKAKPYLLIKEIILKEEIKDKGVQLIMMKYLANLAKSHDSDSMDWVFAKENCRSMEIFEGLGAEKELVMLEYHIQGESFEKLATIGMH